MTALSLPTLVAPSLSAPAKASRGLPSFAYPLAAGAVVVLVALIAFIGYPVVISLGLVGAFTGLTMIVVLTASDLMTQPKRRRAAAGSRRLAR